MRRILILVFLFLGAVLFTTYFFYKKEFVSQELKEKNLRGRVKAVIPNRLSFGGTPLEIYDMTGNLVVEAKITGLRNTGVSFSGKKGLSYQKLTNKIIKHIYDVENENLSTKSIGKYWDILGDIRSKIGEEYDETEIYNFLIHKGDAVIKELILNQTGDTLKQTINTFSQNGNRASSIIRDYKENSTIKYSYQRKGNKEKVLKDGIEEESVFYDSSNNKSKTIEKRIIKKDTLINESFYKDGLLIKERLATLEGETVTIIKNKRDDNDNIIIQEFFRTPSLYDKYFGDNLFEVSSSKWSSTTKVTKVFYLYDTKDNWIAEVTVLANGEIISKGRSIMYYSWLDYIKDFCGL